MRNIIVLLIGLFLLVTPANAENDADPIERVLLNTVSKFIRPGYENFRNSVLRLNSSLEKLCAYPNQPALERAQSAFQSAVASWSEVELIRFGPVNELNRFERILFYPDRKSTGLKQVQRILANQNESARKVSTLQSKSVAVQGLGALEFILFGTGYETLKDGNGFRCEYGQAVSQNLVNLSNELVTGWEDGGSAYSIWSSPGPDNPIIRTSKEAVNLVLGTLVHGLESIRDLRLGSFLKGEPKKDRPRVAIFRRSEITMRVLVSNIGAVKKLLVQSGAIDLLDNEDRYIVDNVVFELNQAERVASEIGDPIAKALESPGEREKLLYLKTSLTSAIVMLDQDFAKSAGLSSGFSFSDGD
ncbi:MAG: imelysin family protein [Pseudomonadota bacterium]